MTERIVLAYSGGLDTSVAIGWIGEATGAEVIAVAVDVGQGGESLETIRHMVASGITRSRLDALCLRDVLELPAMHRFPDRDVLRASETRHVVEHTARDDAVAPAIDRVRLRARRRDV